VRIPLVNVTTPTMRYVKARAELGDAAVTLMDVSDGTVIAHLEGVVRADGPARWRVGDDVVVVSTTGCLCGGTRVEPVKQRWTRPVRNARRRRMV
jgi:hypothetical protein